MIEMTDKEAFLAAIVDTSDDAIISKTLDGVILTWNKAAEKMYGYSETEAVGKHISLIVPPSKINELLDILARLSRGESIAHHETERKRKDGRTIDISLSTSLMRDKEGKVIGVSVIAHDITEHKQMEERLKQQLKELKEFNALMVGRELKMIELENEIKSLKARANPPV